MKKSIIAVVAILLVIALLPIFGNTYVKQTMDDRLVELESFGLKVQNDSGESSYLQSKRHFELLVSDPAVFITYLKKYSDQQVPGYVNAMIDGVTIGVDVEYSNLPFAKAFELEFYPLTLSNDLELSFKQNDEAFYNYMKKFLTNKGVLYHINYNLLNDDFDGYIKDIEEKYTLSSGVDVALVIKKATFKGNGEILTPKELKSSLKEFRLDASQDEKKVHIVINKLTTANNFASQLTYLTSVDMDSMEFKVNGTDQDMDVVVDKFRMNASSNDQGSDIELNSKTSLEKLVVVSKKLDLKLSKFNFDVALEGIDKASFEEFKTLASDSNTLSNPVSSQKMQESFISLLSKGMILKIADFSIEDIETKQTGDLNGYKIDSTLTLKKDDLLADKMKVSPLMALAGLEVDTNINISKEMFHFLAKKTPMMTNFYKYAKEDKGQLIFNLNYKDQKPTINGQPLN